MSDVPKMLEKLASDVGGKIEEVGALPDGSGFATMSMPLPKDHWLTAAGFNVPPMPLRMGIDHPERKAWEARLWAAGRYAVRCATMNGQEQDFDPDALVQSLVTGMLGYFTVDGLSSKYFANPKPVPPEWPGAGEENR